MISSRRNSSSDVDWLRDLAGRGELAEYATIARGPDKKRILHALYEVSWPIVFDVLTRGVELRRGHGECALGLTRLTSECLDRFHDDVEAVVDGAMRRGTTKVKNLEAWIATIVGSTAVDGHRRRRGERGALQRPRVPKWLDTALPDNWSCTLALRILEWVGLPGTAGADLWPLRSWAEERARVTGDWAASTPKVVQTEVDRVLDQMRTHPEWYADYVERPLGRKEIPTAPATVEGVEFAPLPLVEAHESVDAMLTSRARAAIRMIRGRLRADEDPWAAVPAVLKQVFRDDLAAVPGDEEWLATQLDSDYNRITAAVLDIVAPNARRSRIAEAPAREHLRAG